eukprot:s13655_g1.t1
MAMDNAITFQKSKQWKNQCTAFLENALLESEVPDDMVDVAAAFLEHQDTLERERKRNVPDDMVDVAAAFLEHQDTLERERKRNVRNLQARLDPVAPRLQGKMVYLEKPEWQHMPFAADLELSAERRLQARLDPVAPRLQGKMVYLEKPEWQHMPFAADLELSAERRLAEIFVVEDYNSAQRSSWCCALQGAAMVDLEY